MQFKKIGWIGLILANLYIFGGCAAIRPYEKEYLLSPLMDDATIAILQPTYAKSAAGTNERLASGAAGGGGSSCPTCGG